MTIRPSLVRNIPFWILLAVSLIVIAVGVAIFLPAIALMTVTLTDGTATGVEVYAGQSWVFVGASLLGAGVVGLALTLTVAAVSGLRPVEAAPVAAPIEWSEPVAGTTEDTNEVVETGPAAAVDTALADAPATPAAEDSTR